MLEQNPDKINWDWLSENPAAMHLLEQNPGKISWYWLMKNPTAIDLIKKNQELIEWNQLSANPAIFEIDYAKLKERIEPFHEELIQKCFHPSRVERLLMKYNYDLLEDVYWED